MIATLKQHYEYYHAGDLTALKKLYEYHAENCAKAAKLTEDTQQREEYLKLAREWTEAARSALDMNALMRSIDVILEPRTSPTRCGQQLWKQGAGARAQAGPQDRPNQPRTGQGAELLETRGRDGLGAS
jgi:hypothetical protein